LAVVWCRQVDNEAESPGYTTVPEEFPGHHETLDMIRIVGNLTVNVADTHDYWDPDPSQPLSYYPNIFLYPSYGGRHTCVGRMFLSTEDRPRLGMKTVVLDTAQLLATNEFGATVLRWHASMGGARPGGRLPAVPDPALYPIVGEGFLFQRGTTDPVVVVASEQWEPAVQAILEMIRVMPAAMIAPAAILAFPYFLPAAKTDLKEFTEQLPLALALMRIARGEAAGERHGKRIASWEAVSTVRDLTDGIPPTPRGKEAVPLVLQYVRDHNDAKIRPISQRVDLVEIPRLRQRLGDPERSGGKDRRKEMWRLGTAMESAALLLSKARGRHVPVSVETAKRAQEYLQARIPPSASSEIPEEDPAVEGSAAQVPEASGTVHHPPWLQKSEAPAPVRVDRVEVVPVSHSDDPSLLSAAARPQDPANVVPTATPPGGALASGSFRPMEPPSGPTLDPVAFKADLERSVARWVETRLSQFSPGPTSPPSGAFGEEIDRRASKAIEAALARLPPPPPDPTAVEARTAALIDERLQKNSSDLLSQARQFVSDAEARLDRRSQERSNASGAAETEGVSALRNSVERRLQEFAELQQGTLAASNQTLQARVAELEARLGHADEQMAQLSLGNAEAAGTITRLQKDRSHAEGEVVARITAAVSSGLTAELNRQIAPAVQARIVELQHRLEESAKTATDSSSIRLTQEISRNGEQLRLQIAALEEDLRQGLTAQMDLHLREAAQRSAVAETTLETRLIESLQRKLREAETKREKDGKDQEVRLGELVEGRSRELEARMPITLLGPQSKIPGLIDARVSELEGRMAARQELNASELRSAQVAAAAELQVRLQAYFDQRLRESAERERDTSVELLARMKSEMDAALARVAETAPFKEAVAAQTQKLLERERVERDRMLEERLQRSEGHLRTDFLGAVHRLEILEQTLEARGKELREIELSVRADLAEVDRRTAILSDRLVPVVRKTWQRIGELEKGGGAPEMEARLTQIRHDLQRDVRRLEAEMATRDGALRDRMETAISNQGRVWLTLIRQLTQLSGDRRELALPSAAEPHEPEPQETEESEPLDDLPELLRSRRHASRPAPSAERPGEPEDDEPSVRPRRRTPSRGPGA
jgi:hypothetical protein